VVAHLPDSSIPSLDSARLNGWKEIAGYLDRGVRTVQRWEKEFGLPVRRLGPGEGVFALKHEIDAWQVTPLGDRAQSTHPRSTSDNEAALDAEGAKPWQATAEARGGESTDPARLRRRLYGLVLLTIVLAAWSAWSAWRMYAVYSDYPREAFALPSGAPARIQVDLDTLRVLDASGQELWHHQFRFRLRLASYSESNPTVHRLCGIEDIDGDGSREVWFVASPEPYSADQMRLYAFGKDGSLRWSYQFGGTVQFGQERFVPPFPVTGVFVTADPSGSAAKAVWAVSTSQHLFPSLLQRLDAATGATLSSYWSNGFIEDLVLAPWNGRLALYVAANDNEWKAGSLAVLDARRPVGSAPSADARYRCRSCAAGEPLAFVVFPKPARYGHPDVSSPVIKVDASADGSFVATVQHGMTQIGVRALALYTLDAQLRPVRVDLADNYVVAFRQIVREGRAPADAPAAIDLRREFLPLYRWDAAAGRYTTVPNAPVAR
jgi:hypothetical protein